MKKIKKDIIEKINNIKGIEKIIWAYSGSKRCSDFLNDEITILPILESLGLNYDGRFIKAKNWPPWEDFVLKYQKTDNYMSDLATGLFYDIPYCCSKGYQIKVIKSYNNFFTDYPFKRRTTLKGVLELPEKSTSFYDELREHEKIYDFKRKYDQINKIGEESIQLVLSGNLPESIFLLLGQTYVPCKPDCNKFLSKSKKMLKDLKTQLDNERLIQIFKKYKKNTLNNI